MIAALKPITDLFWNVRVNVGGQSLNLNLAMSALSIGCGLACAIRQGLRRDRNGLVCLIALMVVIFGLFSKNDLSKPETLKYASSIAGLYLVSLGVKSAHKFVGSAILFSITITVLSCVAQLFRFLPFHSYDRLPRFEGSRALWYDVGRLSGAFYHPLDLMRVLIWPFWFAVLSFINRNGKYSQKVALILISVFQFLVYRTTHRASMVISLAGVILLGGVQRKLKSTITILFVVATTWVASALVLSREYEMPLRSAFVVGHFLGVGFNPNYDPDIQTDETRFKITENKLALNQGLNFVVRAQGRQVYWRQHAQWLGRFSVREWMFGARQNIPKDIEAEPHNQVIDFIERFGLVGTIILLACFSWLLYSVPSTTLARVIVFGTAIIYGTFTEILVMPTFVWWAAFACYYLGPVTAQIRSK